MSRRSWSTSSLSLLLLLCGCGYVFVGGVVALPPGAETIAVPVFGNRTAEPGIETDFTNSLAFEFNRSRVLKVTSPPADLVLSGSVDELRLEPVAYSREVIAVARRVRLRVSAKLTSGPTGAVLWEDAGILDNEVFPVSEDPLVSEENRRQAIRRIAERIAFQIHNRALEGF